MNAWKAMALLGGVLLSPVAMAGQETLEIPPEMMEAIQGDVATIHQDLMQGTIDLAPGEAGPFWAIYDDYLAEVRTLTAERAELVKDFALAFDTMTDEAAVEMGGRALDADQRRHDVLEQYFARISDELGGKVAGQFLQIESRIYTLKDLRLQLEVPIIGR